MKKQKFTIFRSIITCLILLLSLAARPVNGEEIDIFPK
jgi:hypothetical protein